MVIFPSQLPSTSANTLTKYPNLGLIPEQFFSCFPLKATLRSKPFDPLFIMPPFFYLFNI